MSAVLMSSLHPSTRLSIELQGHRNFGARDCGCETVPSDVARIWLCQYHQGWDDATEAWAAHKETT